MAGINAYKDLVSLKGVAWPRIRHNRNITELRNAVAGMYRTAMSIQLVTTSTIPI